MSEQSRTAVVVGAGPVGREAARVLAEAGHAVRWDTDNPDVRRFHTDDPFGNRLEMVAVETS